MSTAMQSNYSVYHASNTSRIITTSLLDVGGPLYWLTVLSFLLTVLLVIVGVVGNTFIIATVRSKRCQFNSHGVQLTALAVSDIQSLLVSIVNKRFVWAAFGKDIRGLSLVGCRIFAFAARVAKLSSTLFVLIVCIDRFIAVWFPLKAKVFTTKMTSIITVVVIFAFSYGYAFVTAFFSVLKYGKCIPDVVTGSDYWSNVLTVASLFLSTIMPTAVLLCLTPLSVIKLYVQRRLRRRMAPTEAKDETNLVTLTLISISVVYICLVTSLAGTLWILMLTGINPFASRATWAAVFLEVLVTCENLNSALNVFLYGFFSRRFRRDFYNLFKRGQRSNTVGPSTRT